MVADPVHSYEWRFNVLHNCLYPYLQGLYLAPIRLHEKPDAWGVNPFTYDGDCLHGIRSSLGSDEFLGRNGNN